MTAVKRIFHFIRDFVELYIPMACFVLMFLTFILQILCRYVIKQPVTWSYEVTVASFLWLVVLSASYVHRLRGHVAFTLLYDALPVRGQAFTTFLGDLIVTAAFAAMLIPSINYVRFMKIQVTSVLKIGLNIIYAPYIPFVIFILLYSIADLYRHFMIFTGLGGEETTRRLIKEAKMDSPAGEGD